MRTARVLIPLCLLWLVQPTSTLAQGWHPPDDACDIGTGHFLVNGAQQHLRIAADAGDDENRRQGRLNQAHDVLVRAITENDQEENPAAWYYLGRYYVYTGDAAGADSAFRRTLALAPQCGPDVHSYLDQLAPQVLASGLDAWQSEETDSAIVLLHLARSLSPTDADVPFYLSMVYSGRQQFDSALVWADTGISIAGGDPEYEQRTRQALGDIARGQETAAFENPALQRVVASRLTRDSLRSAIERDSTMLADLIRQWGGQNLRPDVRQAVSRDSAKLATQLSQAHQALGDASAAAAGDSTEAARALAGALDAYARYLDAFPNDVSTALRLARRHSMLGQTTLLQPMVDRLLASDSLDSNEMAQLGVSLFNDGNVQAGIRVLEAALATNPYERSALLALCRAHYRLRNAEPLREAAQRLLGLDPLNTQAVRLMAAAWDLAGVRDSAMRYVALADTGLGWAVTITQVVPSPTSMTINGSVANQTAHGLPATGLAFEFLGADGTVLETVTVDVPALEPHRRQSFTARAEQGNIVGWRYSRR